MKRETFIGLYNRRVETVFDAIVNVCALTIDVVIENGTSQIDVFVSPLFFALFVHLSLRFN